MSSQRRVLVVEDEDEIRDGVARWLGAAGFETLQACDGEQGVSVATEARPDAILLDVMMPKLDGMSTLGLLRKDARTSRIPVVMLSASLRDRRRALEAGARFFVPKPYEGAQLLSTVRASIESAARD